MKPRGMAECAMPRSFHSFSSTAFARVLAVAHGQDAGEARAEAAADGQRAEGERSAPFGTGHQRRWKVRPGAPSRSARASGHRCRRSSVEQSGGLCLKRSHSFRHRPPLWLPHWKRMEPRGMAECAMPRSFHSFLRQPSPRVLAVAHGQDAGEARA